MTQTERIYARGVKDLLCNPRYNDTDISGDNLGPVNTTSFDECRRACYGKPGCAALTFDHRGDASGCTMDPTGLCCWLKGANPEPEHAVGRWSLRLKADDEGQLTTTQWAGTLSWYRPEIASDVPMNMTLALSTPTTGIATVDWTFDHSAAGVPCLPHPETLKWTEDAAGRVTALGSGVGEDYYSLSGAVDATGQHFSGNVTHLAPDSLVGRVATGTFSLTKDAPRRPPQCHAAQPRPGGSPIPPPPIPTPSTMATIMPMPQTFSRGAQPRWVDAARFQIDAAPGSSSAVLQEAFVRFRAVFFSHHTGPIPAGTSAPLSQLTVKVQQPSVSQPSLEVDESYNLTVSSGGAATIDAVTVFGAMHGLESFSQLLQFDFDAVAYRLLGLPIRIEDAPRFAWRELMV